MNTVKLDGERDKLVLIAAKPSLQRDSLHALLDLVQGVKVFGCADDSDSALSMVHELQPVLVLLDTNLPGEEMTTMLQRVRSSSTQSRCIVLADTFKQRNETLAAGADAALTKGFRTAELFEIIEKLLLTHPETE